MGFVMKEMKDVPKSAQEVANQYIKDAMHDTIEWVLTDNNGKIHIVYIHDINYDNDLGICIDYSTLSKEDPELVDSLVYECASKLFTTEMENIKNKNKGFLQWMKSFFRS